MNEHLAFAQCLQRVLNETELTATEVARRLEMRSRNSIFRILKGKTSPQLNRRFLESFHKHMGEQLTEAQWAALNRALEMDAVGAVEYKSRQALMQLVGAFSEPISPRRSAIWTRLVQKRRTASCIICKCCSAARSR